jgi:Leucine-rich repeat (LRR) protein
VCVVSQIVTVPPLSALTNLRYVDISHNAIKDGFERLFGLTKVKYLYLNSNRLDMEQDSFNDVSFLELCFPEIQIKLLL